MDDDTRALIELGEEAVERARIISSQPRFKETSTEETFAAVLRWYKAEDQDDAPAYSANSRERDGWLQKAWRREPHLAGVVNSVVLIDTNRGWTLTGGRNQVIRFSNILYGSEMGMGWRYLTRRGSLSFWTTDLGAPFETGRDGKRGPLRGLFNVDPAQCALTGSAKEPLKYYPPRGRVQKWSPWDYFRVASLPSDQEAFHGLGFCAVSRAIELTKLLLAVYHHDQEELGSRSPRGLLFLHNISENQWNDAMTARDARMTNKEMKYYGGVEVFASMGVEEAGATLVGLSQLPDNFDREVFTNQLLYGYSLIFGYDWSEFWPAPAGVMGRGNETQVQHQKASGKGGQDYVQSFQDQLQNNPMLMPETLLFEFEERDDAGALTAAEVNQANADVVTSLYEAGLKEGAPLVTLQEARSLLADYDLIPYEWTEMEEETQATDIGEERERVQSILRVRDAAERFPAEPIVQHHYPTGKTRVLWDQGADLLRRVSYPVTLPDALVTRDVLFDGLGGVTITDKDVDQAIAAARRRVGDEFAELLEAEVVEDE